MKIYIHDTLILHQFPNNPAKKALTQMLVFNNQLKKKKREKGKKKKRRGYQLAYTIE